MPLTYWFVLSGIAIIMMPTVTVLIFIHGSDQIEDVWVLDLVILPSVSFGWNFAPWASSLFLSLKPLLYPLRT